jgi:hypothetical protein
MLGESRSIREIAAALGLSRNTVRRFARAGSPEELLVNDGTGLRPDQDAVITLELRRRRRLRQPQMLKRQIYGRASRYSPPTTAPH